MDAPRTWGLALAGILLCTAVSAAESSPQDPVEVGKRLAERASANLELLRGYAWTSRTEIHRKDKLHTVKVETVRFGADGRLERTMVDEQGPKRKDGPSGERQRDKIERLYEWMGRLMRVLQGYKVTEGESVVAAQPKWTLGSGGSTGTLRLTGVGIMQPDDRLTLWVIPETGQVRRSHVFTRIDKDDVMMETEYGRLDGGVVYPASRLIRVPSERVEIRIENSGFAAVSP